MADITMCIGTGCKLQKTCYRVHAPASYYQSISGFPGMQGKPCIYFIEYKPSGKSDTELSKMSMHEFDPQN